MKKALTLLMAFGLMANAFATSKFEVKQNPQSAPQQQQITMDEPNIVLPDFIDKQKLSDLSECPVKIYATHPDMLQRNLQAPAIRKASNAKPTTITINGGSAMYLGTFYYLNYGTSIPAWELCLTSSAKDTVWLDFMGYSSKYIEGKYRGVVGKAVLKGTKEVEVNGELTIAYKEEGTSASPTYTFTANLLDENGNEYVVSGDYAFVNSDQDAEVMDIGFYMLYYQAAIYCYYYKMYCDEAETYASYMLMTLADAPVEPTGKETTLNIGQAYTKRYDSGKGNWYVMGTSEQAAASIGFYGDFANIAGTYTESDFYRYYTQLAAITPDTTIGVAIYKPQSLTVTQVEDTTFFEEVLMGRDGNTYNVNMFYVEPSSEDTITIATIAYGNYDDYTKEEGLFMASAIGMLKDSTMAYIGLGLYANQMTGTFTTKNNYSNYNFIALFGEDTVYYEAIIDTIKVVTAPAAYADGFDYIAQVVMLGQNEDDPTDVHWFKAIVGMISYFQPDAAEDIETTFDEEAKDLIVFDKSAFQQNGYVKLQAAKADTSDYFYGVFFPEELDESTVLPDGEYTIDDSEDYNTMLASTGYDVLQMTTYPSFYSTKEKIWFIVDGIFTVNGGEMKLNGINSNGKDVTITFKRKITALNEVMGDGTKAVKAMVNGQLVIKKNGKLYNAQGAEIAE